MATVSFNYSNGEYNYDVIEEEDNMTIIPKDRIQNDILQVMLGYELTEDEMVITLEEMLSASYAHSTNIHYSDDSDKLDFVDHLLNGVRERVAEILSIVVRKPSNDN